MYLYFFMLLSSAYLSANDTQHAVMPPKDEQLNAYPTLNQHGFCFEPTDLMSAKFAYDIAQHRGKNENTTVLEVGVGYGFLAESILKIPYKKNECFYMGIDLDKHHLEIAEKRIAQSGIDGTFACNVEEFPQDNCEDDKKMAEIYDFFGAIHFMHFYNPERFKLSLRAIEHLLAKGGKAYIYTSHADTEAYGPAIRQMYDEQKAKGVEFPGYIENVPALVEDLVKKGSLPKERAENPTFKQSLAPTFLFLTTEEFCEHVRKETKLIIAYSATIAQHQHGKLKKYVGVVLEKPKA